MPPINWDRLLDPGHWLDPNPGPPSAYYYFVFLFFVLGLSVCFYLYFYHARRRLAGFPLQQQVVQNVGTRGGIAFAVGLVLVGLRMLEVPFLSARILLYLDILALLALGAYLAYYLIARYHIDRAEYLARAQRQRPITPRPRPRAAPGRRKRKGKR